MTKQVNSRVDCALYSWKGKLCIQTKSALQKHWPCVCYILPLARSLYIYIYIYMCVCVRVCVFGLFGSKVGRGRCYEANLSSVFTHMYYQYNYIYIYIYIYIYNSSARTRCDRRSIFEQSLTRVKLEFDICFPSPRIIAVSRLKSQVCTNIYP